MKKPLFCRVDRCLELPTATIHRNDITGITANLENDGAIENARATVVYVASRTTKLHDHTEDRITWIRSSVF